MNPGQIRPIVVCVFRDGDRILAAEFEDPASGKQFYRPLGGAIHFGEHSRDCIVREIREEMGAEITDLNYVATMENIFTYDGRPGHEIVLVYEANLAEPRLDEVETLRCQDDGGEFMAVWKHLAYFQAGKAPLYPEGILELLSKMASKR